MSTVTFPVPSSILLSVRNKTQLRAQFGNILKAIFTEEWRRQRKEETMGTMRAGLGLLLVVLVLLPACSDAIWPVKKDPESAPTAGGAAKEYAKEAVRNTADAFSNVGESIKQTANAAYDTTVSAAQAVTGGNSDRTSRGTGAAYRDRAGNYISDSATATRGAAGTVKDTAANAVQAARDTSARAYDATADTLGNAKDRVWGSEPEPTYTQRASDAARRVNDNVRDGASRAYDRTTGNVDDRSVFEKAKDSVWGSEPEPTYTQRAADSARRASDNVRNSASRAYDRNTRDYDDRGVFEKAKDKVWGTDPESTYRNTRDYDDRGVFEKAKDKVWGTEPEPTYSQRAADSARRASDNVRNSASRAYDRSTGRDDDRGVYEKARDSFWGSEREPTYAERAADSARRARDSVRNGASRAYDVTTAPFTPEDDRSYYEKAKDSSYRALGYEAPSDRGYGSRAYDSARDGTDHAYESGKSRLGSIVEILGWHRVHDDGPATATLGKYHSPYDVTIGSTRYAWRKRNDEPESYYESAKSKVADTATGASDALGRAKDATVDTASRAKDATVDTASRATETVKDAAEKTSEKGKKVAAAAAAAVGADKLVKDGFFRRLWRLLHLLTWGVAFGTAVWMTFMSGRALQQNMPRHQFDSVQTKLFPLYLQFLTAAEGALAFLYAFLRNSSKWQILNLLFLVGTTAYNAYVLEPKTTKNYLERIRLEKEEGRGLDSSVPPSLDLEEKNKKFKELHGYSASLNLLSLLGLTYHAWNLISKIYS